MSADEVIDTGFEKAEARMAALRLTPKEFVEGHCDFAYVTYWRSRKATAKPPKRTQILRQIEAQLDELEKDEA